VLKGNKGPKSAFGVGNPYAPGLLQAAAFDQGRRARASGVPKVSLVDASYRTQFAWERGFYRTRWHRSPNGQVKWCADRE
jgi:hypothetical protein